MLHRTSPSRHSVGAAAVRHVSCAEGLQRVLTSTARQALNTGIARQVLPAAVQHVVRACAMLWSWSLLHCGHKCMRTGLRVVAAGAGHRARDMAGCCRGNMDAFVSSFTAADNMLHACWCCRTAVTQQRMLAESC